MKKTIFTGAGVAIVTPMNPDESINFDRLGQIIDSQIENGTDAIVICGTTGESATMTDQEHVDCIEYAVKRVNGRVPVVAGAGSNHTSYAVWMSKEAKRVGADALLHVTPYYNKTSQTGLIRHFNAVADATDLPIILYNVPSRTGVNITPATYRELAKHPNIVAAKEASGNISQIAQIAQACGDELDLYSGNDDQIVPLLSLGAKGVISVLSNIMPRETHDICRLFFEGKIAESRALQLKLLPLINALFSDVNPIPVKEAMNMMGWECGECRLPLVSMQPQAKEHLRVLMQEQGLMQVIRERVPEGVPYVGWSAGSNVACPTICTTNDMPIVEPASFNAAGLIPFQINPHYLDAHPDGHAGETREQRILEYIAANPGMYVAGLREGCMLKFENGMLTLVGSRPMRIFRQGEKPYEVNAGDDLSFLL